MQQKSKFERIFTLVSIITLCVSIGILVLAFVGRFPLNRFFLDLLLILAILSLGCVTSLSAIKMIMLDKKNIYGYVLIGMTGLICLLWIICVFVARGLIDALVAQTVDISHLANAWGFVKTTIFLSLLQSLASLIINNWLKYKKKNFALQIAMYACNFIVTLWLSIVVLSMVVTDAGLAFTANWLFDSAFIITIFILALVFSWVAKLILRNITRREEREQLVNSIAATKIIEAQKENIKKSEDCSTNDQPNDELNEKPKEDKNDPWSQE